jgi:hypothetical protein
VINNVASTYNLSAPVAYQPAGRQAVSQESTELKSSSFRPTEQSAEASRQQNRRAPEDNPAQGSEEDRLAKAGKPSAPVEEQKQRKERAQKEQRESEQKVIDKLSSRDREVRAHEQAHAAVGGQYAGSPTYTYQRGPDGVNYAVGGEVKIDTSPIPNDPEATLRKAEQISRAANAPADPSGQDRVVASQAVKMAQQARIEINQKVRERAESQSAPEEDKKVESSSNEESPRSEALAREKEKEEKSLKDADLQSQKQAERSRQLAELQQKNIKINRRLLEINSFETETGVGRFLDKSV